MSNSEFKTGNITIRPLQTLSAEDESELKMRREHEIYPRRGLYINQNYKRLNRSYLKKSLEMFWCEAPFVEMKKIIKTLIESDQTIPQLHSLFTRLKSLSVGSAEGFVVYGGFKNIENIITIKYGKSYEDNKSVRHEYQIGLILNMLRSECPNFMYTYYNFLCRSDQELNVIGEDVIVCDELLTSEKQSHLALEYISNSSTFDKIIKEINVEETRKILLSIFCALKLGEKYKYVHGDLHLKNILIRVLKSPIVLKYRFPNKPSIYISTRFVPVIIDYGFSRATYKGVIYSKPEIERYNLPIDSSKWVEFTPYIDFYKIVSSLYTNLDLTNISNIHLYNKLLSLISSDLEDIQLIRNITNPELRSISLEVFRNRFNYPTQIFEDYDHNDVIRALANDNDFNPLSTPKCISNEEFLRNLYPKGVNVCNGEYGDINYDDDGLYRSMFDCSKEYFDGKSKVIEFGNNITLYQGDLKNNIRGKEFDYSYYNRLELTQEDITKLKNGVDVNDIMEKMYSKDAIVWYGTLTKAISDSLNDKCVDKCIRAYKIKDKLILLDMVDTHNIFQLYTYMKNVIDKLLFIVYHGYNFNDERYHNLINLKNDIEILIDQSHMHYDEVYEYVLTHFENFEKEIRETPSLCPIPNDLHDLYKSLQKGAVYFFEQDETEFNIHTSLEELNQKMFLPTQDRNIIISRKNVITDFQTWKSKNSIFENRLTNENLNFLGFPENCLTPMFSQIMNYCQINGYDGFAYRPCINYNSEITSGLIALGFNQHNTLRRDLDNPYDWQSSQDIQMYGEVTRLIQDLKEYKTTNINLYSGNIIETTMWSVLYMNWLYAISHPVVSNLGNEYMKKCLLASAFLSEVGNAGDRVFTYYDKPDRYDKISGYFEGTDTYIAKDGSTIDLYKVLNEMNVPEMYHNFAIFLLKHTEFFKNLILTNQNRPNIDRLFYGHLSDLFNIEFSNGIDTDTKYLIFRALFAMIHVKILSYRSYPTGKKLNEFIQTYSNKKANKQGHLLYELIAKTNDYVATHPYIINRPSLYVGNSLVYTDNISQLLNRMMESIDSMLTSNV